MLFPKQYNTFTKVLYCFGNNIVLFWKERRDTLENPLQKPLFSLF
jgi:hypothetical protein